MIYRLSAKSESDHPRFQEVALSTLKDAGWTEKDLENYLAENVTQVLRDDQLMVISQESSWEEAPDILALDPDGVLYIFELKRWEGRSENLLQVLRYGQLFGTQPYRDLDERFRRRRGDGRELVEAHRVHFELGELLAIDRFNQKQHFVVVTAGHDMATLDAITYWRDKGVPISSMTYHVYHDGGSHYLEWDRFSPTPDDYAGLVSKCFVVNTNVSYDGEAYLRMIGNGRDGKAAAYGSRKSAVDTIDKGSTVFLYHTGVGIIARGKATDSYREAEFRNYPAAEHYVPLRFDPEVDPQHPFAYAVPAFEINERMQTSHRFRQTAFNITKEMAAAIEELLRNRSTAG